MRNKKKLKDIWFIGLSILIITLLHYFTIIPKWDIHEFYRRLYYIPIVVAAFKFRLRGGVLTSLGVLFLYAPHLVIYLGEVNIVILNQILEAIMFIIIGTVTGFLVESDYKKKKLLELKVEQLTNLENYTENILDSITNVFITVDRDLKIHSINKEGKELFKLGDTSIGRELDAIFLDYNYVKETLKELFTNKRKMVIIETSCINKSNENIHIKLYAYPLRNITGKIEGVVIVLEDISEFRKLEDQIRRAEKLSAVGELASGIAHEIRNPLGIIKTISQTIYQDTKEEEMKEGIDIIIHEVDRANYVIKGLLDFAKPSFGHVAIQSIDKIIRSIILITTNYAQQFQIDLRYHYNGHLLAMVDKESLKQAFINIIFNAIQAMPNGGIITITALQQESWAKISFMDEGIGIPKDKLEKIFEPFYTTKDSGTGLGLPITHRIIEEHKGSIEVQSTMGEGTTIDIYLPMVDKEDDLDEKNTYS